MATEWQPAPRPQVLEASGDGERIFFGVEGQKPSSCYEVRLFQSLADIFPPIYLLLMRQTDEVCPQVVTNYKLEACGQLGGPPPFVFVQDAEGQREVEVQKVGPGGLAEACRAAEPIEEGPPAVQGAGAS